MLGMRFHGAVGATLMMAACSAPSEAKAPDPFRRVLAAVAGSSRGVSGSAVDGDGQLWGVAERKLLPKSKTTPGGLPAAPPPTAAPRKSAGGRNKSGPAKPAEDGFFGRVRKAWEEVLEQAKKK